MPNFDFEPLFRVAVGFDKVAEMLEAATRAQNSTGGYPPYNIEQNGKDDYLLTLAVAGLSPDDIEIVAEPGQVIVRGKSSDDEAEKNKVYLHRGISRRAFERKFALGEYVEVDSASLEHGLLSIRLRRVIPEAKRPRMIAIGGSPQKLEVATSQDVTQEAA